jgi:hypothetical protein
MSTDNQRPDLAAIQRRREAATPGDWEVVEIPNPLNALGSEKIPNSTRRPELQIQTAWVHPQLKDKHPIVGIWYGPYHERAYTVMLRPEDAEFIAHARTDIPALLAEIERLTHRNSDLQRQMEQITELKQRNAERWQDAQNRLGMVERLLYVIHGAGPCGIDDSINLIAERMEALERDRDELRMALARHGDAR